MTRSKFTMNALLVIVITFSVIWFFFNVKLFDMAGGLLIFSDDYPIEGTDLTIHYGTIHENGIYKGSVKTGDVMLEGTFGTEWGLAIEGNKLYLNEYYNTDIGLALCDFVEVDMDSLDEEILMEYAILRGRCASGELVVLTDCFLSPNMPQTNSLCKMFCMSSSSLTANNKGATVSYIDPKTKEIVYSVYDENAMSDSFEATYLDRTLSEVQQ